MKTIYVLLSPAYWRDLFIVIRAYIIAVLRRQQVKRKTGVYPETTLTTTFADGSVGKTHWKRGERAPEGTVILPPSEG